jgi:hypothetical protein
VAPDVEMSKGELMIPFAADEIKIQKVISDGIGVL